MNFRLVFLGTAVCLFVLTGLAPTAWADPDPAPPPIENPNSLGGSLNSVFTNIVSGDTGLAKKENIVDVIVSVINWLLVLSAVLAMGAIVWGGITMIISFGDEEKAKKAKGIIKFAVLGVVVILMSYVIIAFVQARLTAFTPIAIPTAYAQGAPAPAPAAKGTGFNEGKGKILEKIATPTSGLATDPDLLTIIIRIINFLLGGTAILALLALVWGAGGYTMSFGNEEKAAGAKRTMLYAIVGVLLTGLSFVFLRIVQFLLTGAS